VVVFEPPPQRAGGGLPQAETVRVVGRASHKAAVRRNGHDLRVWVDAFVLLAGRRWEALQESACCRFPATNFARAAVGYQPLAVRDEGKGVVLSVTRLETVQQLAGGPIPDVDLAITATSRQQSAIRGKMHAARLSGSPPSCGHCQQPDFAAARHLPDANCTVGSSRGQPLAVGRRCHRPDFSFVPARDRHDLFAILGVKEPHAVVLGRHCQKLAVRGEGQRRFRFG